MVEDSIWCWLLGLCPLGYEICERLRLDGLARSEIYVECPKFDCPLRDASSCISIA
jgi:hypothetical protein